jgi:hypothetical protein
MKTGRVLKVVGSIANNSFETVTGQTGPTSTAEIDHSIDLNEADDFLNQNSTYWDSFYDPDSESADGYMLIDATTDQLNNLITNCAMGIYVAKVKNLRPLYILNVGNQENVAVCSSFADGKVVPIGFQGYTNRTFAQSIFDFMRLNRFVNNAGDLIELTSHGIPIGDLVYSSTVRNSGEGTFDEMTNVLRKQLFQTLVYQNHYQTVFDEYDIEAALIGHPLYARGGVISRTAIEHGANCYYPTTTFFQKLRSIKELRQKPGHPTSGLFFDIYDERREEAIQGGERVIADRLGVKPADMNSKQAVQDRGSEYCPTAVIFPHIFIEHLRYTDKLFKDPLTWFRSTLQIAKEVDSVDWRVKPHPNRDIYEMEQDVFEEVSRVNQQSDHSIDMLPEDMTTRELIETTDVILTMDGTAGMEYACFGIPTIIASETVYSGYGFTVEPESQQEFADTLRSLDEVDPLTPAEIERAKVICYLYFDLVRDHWPAYSAVQDEKWGADYSSKGGEKWSEALIYLEELKTVENKLFGKVKRLVEGHDRYIY